MNLIRMLKPDRLSPGVVSRGTLAVRQETILQIILNILLAIYTLGFAGVLIFSSGVIRSGNIWIYLLVYLGVAAVTIFRQIPFPVRAAVIILMLQALGAAALLSYGLSGTGFIFLFASILLSTLLFSARGTMVFILLSLGIIAWVGGSMVAGRISLPPAQVMANSGNPVQWLTAALVLVFAVGITASSTSAVVRGMGSALKHSEKLSMELEKEQASLERRVEERSADLKKRVEQFEIASQIAREISGTTNLESLLSASVNLVRDRFGFYHVGVFVSDERGDYAVLRAATGEAGRAMLERNHRLKIGEIGIVGYVVSHGEARIALDVAGDVVHYKNPLLPETRSEMALPLRVADRTIGALDVQSVLENAFTLEDVQILQTIADQLAVAFEKTRLVTELQRSLDEMEASTRSATQKAWRTHFRNTRQQLAYHYRQSQFDHEVEETQHAQEAAAQGKPVLKLAGKDEQGKPFTVFAVPIKLRNQVLGVVDIRFENANVSPELISLIEATVDRLAVSLENARLLEEIRSRAERDQAVSEISTKVRAAADVDSVLRIAVEEIGRSLGVSEVMVQLRKES